MPLAPQVGPMDMGQPMLTPDKFWRLLNDPGLTYPVLHPSPQAVSSEAFLGLSHEVQALTEMIQAIIPHIPQLTQTMAPPQSEPQCSSLPGHPGFLEGVTTLQAILVAGGKTSDHDP
ncbi:hypothetical protein B296_00041120 [Ensete ventricosum]|uniref:Uncharacterized protein n=1 Tax=Ensete ventricosum TaxID=4639 RepID=A0A426YUS1_ENSVE|nr:hypothetical protein B296_00041120 [Ensete ventricosum]